MATDVESGYLGAVTHGALAVVAAFEGMAFKSRTAKLLAGAVFGWHAYATFYHLREKREEKRRAKCLR
jgi:hypothetical protein